MKWRNESAETHNRDHRVTEHVTAPLNGSDKVYRRRERRSTQIECSGELDSYVRLVILVGKSLRKSVKSSVKRSGGANERAFLKNIKLRDREPSDEDGADR